MSELTDEILHYVDVKFTEAEREPTKRFSRKFDIDIQGADLISLKVILLSRSKSLNLN